jgi:hypothetical protein
MKGDGKQEFKKLRHFLKYGRFLLSHGIFAVNGDTER